MQEPTQIEKQELSARKAREKMDRRDTMLRLSENPDFQAIVTRGYLEENATRLVHLYGCGRLTDEQRHDVEREMFAVGAFRSYMTVVVAEGNQAERDYNAAQEMLSRLREEEAFEAQMDPRDRPVEVDADYAGSLGA